MAKERKKRTPFEKLKPFTDAQAGLLIAGMMSLLAEQEALEKQMKYDIENMQKKAGFLISAAEEKTNALLDLEAKISEGRMLLDQLKEINKAAEG